jgi:hypothetical protein
MKLHGPAALGLSFQCSFDLRHGGDMANPFFSPTVERAPTGTVDFGEAPRTVDFAWAATHQCSSKLGRQLRFGQDFLKIEDRWCSIYWEKWPISNLDSNHKDHQEIKKGVIFGWNELDSG